MPRIPSAADVNPVSAAVTRLPTVRADAADFGYGVAKGVKELAGGIAGTGPLLHRLVEGKPETEASQAEEQKPQQQANAAEPATAEGEAAKLDANAEKLKLAQKETDLAACKAGFREDADTIAESLNGSDGPDAGTGEKAAPALKAAEEKRLKTLPAEYRAEAKVRTGPVREAHAVRMKQREHNRQVAALEQKKAETLQLVQNQAVRHPEAAMYLAAEGTAYLQSQLRAGALTPEQFAAQNETFRRNLFAAVVRGQPAAEALADLEDGVYDKALGDPELKRFLMQETGWRLRSEAALGEVATEGQVARVRRGESGPGMPGARPGSGVAAVGEVGGEPKVEIAARARADLEKLRYAPELEVAEAVAAALPAAGAPDAEAQRAYWEEFWTQSQIMLRERRRDPAAYAMGQPAVAAAFAAAEKNPALLPDAVAARLATQAAMGLTPEAQKVLTNDERARIRAGLMRLPPKQRIAALMELGNLYGDQNGAVAADLAEAGLSVSELLAGDPSGGPEVSGQLAQAAEGQGEAKAPETGVIQEAAEKLIGEGKEAADEQVRQEEREGREPKEGRFLRVPPKKPMPRRIFDEQETLSRHRELLASDIDEKALNDAPEDTHLRRLIAQLGEQADQAGVSSELRQLAIKFGVQKLVVEGNGPPRAHRLGADEAGIEPLVPSRGYSFDNSAFRPRDQKSVLAEARTYLDAFKLDYQVDDEAAAAILSPALREFWSIREATRLHGAAEFERRIDNLVQAGMKAGIDIPRDDVRDLAWAAIDDPFQHPWAQTEFELAASLKRLAEQVEAAGDVGLIQSIGGTLVDLAPGGGTFAKGAKKIGTLAYDLWGIGSALSTEKASDLLARSVKELLRRNGSPQ